MRKGFDCVVHVAYVFCVFKEAVVEFLVGGASFIVVAYECECDSSVVGVWERDNFTLLNVG